jgi:hypothetical protein
MEEAILACAFATKEVGANLAAVLVGTIVAKPTSQNLRSLRRGGNCRGSGTSGTSGISGTSGSIWSQNALTILYFYLQGRVHLNDIYRIHDVSIRELDVETIDDNMNFLNG